MLFHNYILLSCLQDFKKLSHAKQISLKKKFLNELRTVQNGELYTYATLGLKNNTILMFWFQADSVITIQNELNHLLHTALGQYLHITYTLLGISRPSTYSSKHAENQMITTRTGADYLIIYPFTKTKDWYALSFEQRKILMQGHIAIGRKFPQIKQLLLYSYGVDDNEFIVSYETDNLLDFQTLVMELRFDAVRKYTLKDTPIFTCIYKPIDKILDFI